MKVNPLVRGLCPVCNKTIIDKKQSIYINGGFEFFVLLNDNSKITFAICQECFDKLTMEQLQEIMRRNIAAWGEEIQKQLEWYSKTAVHLRPVKWAKDKSGLSDSI